MAATGGIVLSCLSAIHRCSIVSGAFPGVLLQVRHYAARKGTREKARKKKVKVEVKKLTLADKIRKSKKINITKPDAILYNDEFKKEATDNVWIGKFFKFKVFPFAEAIQCHREILHPTMYNAPESFVRILAELNMVGVKKTKPVETFYRICSMKHPFDHGEDRKVLVFCKSDDQIKLALDNGAALAGGSDIIKLIMNAEVSLHNYDLVIAHPTMMPEVLTLRGLLKKKLPTLKGGTLGPDIKSMLETQLHGIRYTGKSCDHFPEHGLTEFPIGKLNMDINHLEDNFRTAIDSIMENKPKRPGSFITRIRLTCPPSAESLKIDHTLYIKQEEPEEPKKKENDEESDDEEEGAVAAAV